MPSKNVIGLIALGTGFIGVAGFALWTYLEQKKRHQRHGESRIAALMLSNDLEDNSKTKDLPKEVSSPSKSDLNDNKDILN